MEHGRTVAWWVNTKVAGVARRTFTFDSEHNARQFYQNLVESGVGAIPAEESVEDRLHDAKEILRNPSGRFDFPKTLSLAFALDRALGKTSVPDHEKHRENTFRALTDRNTLPQVEDFESWFHGCLRILGNHKVRRVDAPIGRSALRKRIQFFRRALEKVAAFPSVFGDALATKTAAAVTQARILGRVQVQGAVEEHSHAPLGLDEIQEVLDSAPGLNEKLFVLRSLCCGLRPGEVLRLQEKHVVRGRLVLSKVITKTRVDKRPPATLPLLLCLRFGGPPSSRWLASQIGVAAYRFRTTLATHLVFCGVDVNSVAEFLGHRTSEMVVRRYSTVKPPGAGDKPDAYYRTGRISVKQGSVEVEAGVSLSAYHRWLLVQVLKVLFAVATEEEKNLVRAYVVEAVSGDDPEAHRKPVC
jgi:integrase